MALLDIPVPQMGEGLQEVIIVEFQKKPGDTIKRDDILYSMETDKAVMEVESPVEGVLKEWLADRFEVLMVSQDVLAELAAFNLNSVADLIGADAEVRLDAIIKDRQELVARSLRALSLQYPGYSESIRDRQLERALLAFFWSLEEAERARAAHAPSAEIFALRHTVSKGDLAG